MINYLVGDATEPIGDGEKVICHCCNNIGGWGRGFVLAVSAKWSEPEARYREWSRSGKDFVLGQIQLVKVEDDITVANMIGQSDMYARNGVPPIRYGAIEECLVRLDGSIGDTTTIHMPRMGAGLAGGEWDKIEEIINKILTKPVYVYDLES